MIRAIRVTKNSKGQTNYSVLYKNKEVKYTGKAPKTVLTFIQTHAYERFDKFLLFR